MLILLLSIMASTNVKAQNYYEVIAQNLNVRSQASSNASVVVLLQKGAIVEVVSKQGNWANIKYDNKQGYVSLDYIIPLGDEGTEDVVKEETRVAEPQSLYQRDYSNRTDNVISQSSQEQQLFSPTTVNENRGEEQSENMKDKWIFTGKIGFSPRNLSIKGGENLNLNALYSLRYMFGASYFIDENAYIKMMLGFAQSCKSKNENKIFSSADLYSIPLSVSINYLIPTDGKRSGLALGAGLYLDYALGGKIEVSGYSYKEKIKFKDLDGFNDMIAGLNASVSYLWKGGGVFVEYGLGLTERMEDVKENYWAVGLTYDF